MRSIRLARASLALVVVALVGCGHHPSRTVSAGRSPFVRAAHNEAGPGSGPWLAWRGLFEQYRDGAHFSVLFAVRNRSRSDVTLVDAGGAQPGHRLLRRVGVQLNLALRPPKGDLAVIGLRSWRRSSPAPVAVQPGRVAWVQFDFVMTGCRFFDAGVRQTYNRRTVLRYRVHGRSLVAALDLVGDQVTITAPPAARCPGGRTAAWKRALQDAYDEHLDVEWPCPTLREAVRHLPAGGGMTYSRLPGLLARATRAACASASASPKTGAREAVAAIERRWRRELESGALRDRETRFPSPPKRVLVARLGAAASRYDFDVVSVTMLHVRGAPRVIVRGPDRNALARATPAILRLVDPKRRTGDDRTGWAYEGFFLEAQDARGIPFLVAFNHRRGPHAGGGQWASSRSLLPFAHG